MRRPARRRAAVPHGHRHPRGSYQPGPAPAHVPGRKPSQRAAPTPNDTLVDAGPPVPVNDLAAVGGSESPAASFRVGNYDVITRIAQGGHGVHLPVPAVGRDGFQRLFVLKAVRQHSAQTEAAIRSFQREARIGGLLIHPNVLSVIDVGTYQDQPFLILDYVDGASLSTCWPTARTPSVRRRRWW